LQTPQLAERGRYPRDAVKVVVNDVVIQSRDRNRIRMVEIGGFLKSRWHIERSRRKATGKVPESLRDVERPFAPMQGRNASMFAFQDIFVSPEQDFSLSS